MNPVQYFKDTLSELKQVQWPSRQKTAQLSAIVVAVSILMAAYVGALDFGFANLLKYLIK
ncbi:MAG: preprotein translocase subunit SecE [Candidatus Amesbacteria bacterium]|jgi:preprotein translocase SecE subunit|nr:preprotein translocase subunit SecE [Candidatus Amesbacteria bacterium]